MIAKKTITDILKLLPTIVNRTWKSAGVYAYETDNTKTGRTNKTDTFEPSTDPFALNEEKISVEGKTIIKKD